MNKANLIDVVADKTGMKKTEAKAAVDAMFVALEEAFVAGDKVQIAGFGTFDVKLRAAKEGRNPKTNEKITIPAAKKLTFSAGKAIKDAINA